LELWERDWSRFLQTLNGLQAEDLEETVLVRGEPHSVPLVLERSLGHTCYHIGQIVQVARIHAVANWRFIDVLDGLVASDMVPSPAFKPLGHFGTGSLLSGF
jgi:hypothetical protein